MSYAFKLLRPKYKKFVRVYLETWNASEAARQVGYKGARSDQAGYEYLRKPEIAAAIKELVSLRTMGVEEVTARLGEQGRVNIGLFITAEGSLDIEAVRKYGHLVKRVIPGRYGTTIELVDNQAALFKIAEMLGLVRQRVSHENPDGSPVEQKVVTIYIPDNGRKRTTQVG